MARVWDPDIGENILDGGWGGEVLVKEQLLWNNPLVISLVWSGSKVPTRRKLDLIVVLFSIPCHPWKESEELATPEDGCHPVAEDPPALLLILSSALLQKSNFSGNWGLVHSAAQASFSLGGNESHRRPIKVKLFTRSVAHQRMDSFRITKNGTKSMQIQVFHIQQKDSTQSHWACHCRRGPKTPRARKHCSPESFCH